MGGELHESRQRDFRCVGDRASDTDGGFNIGGRENENHG